jgi:DNA adenine methylase
VSSHTHQPLLFGHTPDGKIVNVASVPQRSPFRYPGGKTWLVPRVRRWLGSLKARPAEFVEPFAGGAIIGLTVAAESLAEHVTLVELDEQVAAVWKTVFTDGDGAWLADKILNFDLTLESLTLTLSSPARTTRERAFQTILKNRTHHGGILAPGSAPLKRGENGKGIASRWYADTLARRILALGELRGRITVVEGDGLEVMRRNIRRRDAAFFIDPPYTAGGKRAGSRLYTHSEIDHEDLFRLTSQAAGDFLMTYDNAKDVQELADKYGFAARLVAMKNTHHAKMSELLIGRDLSWAGSPEG